MTIEKRKPLCTALFRREETCRSYRAMLRHVVIKTSIWCATRTSLLFLCLRTFAAQACKPFPGFSVLQTDWTRKLMSNCETQDNGMDSNLQQNCVRLPCEVFWSFGLAFSRRSILSKAKSYSIVLGWEQCEVATALLCKKDSYVKYHARTCKTSQSL